MAESQQYSHFPLSRMKWLLARMGITPQNKKKIEKSEKKSSFLLFRPLSRKLELQIDVNWNILSYFFHCKKLFDRVCPWVPNITAPIIFQRFIFSHYYYYFSFPIFYNFFSYFELTDSVLKHRGKMRQIFYTLKKVVTGLSSKALIASFMNPIQLFVQRFGAFLVRINSCLSNI